MKSFFALVTPFDPGAHPDHELPGQQPKPPTGAQPPRPDHTLPGDLPIPAHPIWYPLPPNAPVDPGYGIPEDGPHPDQGLPGSQPHPDQGLPGSQPHPSHPIVLPPDSGSWRPVFIWGPTDPRPTPPIVIPPSVEIEGENMKAIAMWTPENGWETIVILKPQKPVPTPSKKK